MSEHIHGQNSSDFGHNTNIVVGLDIGTTKVCAIVAEVHPNDETFTILGFGQAPSDGLNRGVVVNIERTVAAIAKAVEHARQQSGVDFTEVVVGIAGDHIQSFQTTGIVTISNPTREITKADIDRLLEETRKINLPSDRKILHVIPQDFIIDGQDGIADPIGMSGIRVEARVHVVTGLVTAAQNIYRCVERAGLTVRDIVLEPLASSYAVLTPEEKEVGVALIDIGGGTTDIAVFEEGIIRQTSVFGIAGNQVTEDVRQTLGILQAQAERVKREYGHTYLNGIMNDEAFMIPGIAGRAPKELTKSILCGIVQPRMEELLEFALAEIRKSGFAARLAAGVVITGGGSLLQGVEDLATEMFGMPVKIGYPICVSYGGLGPEVTNNPQFATGVGLVKYALVHHPVELELEPIDAGTAMHGYGYSSHQGTQNYQTKHTETHTNHTTSKQHNEEPYHQQTSVTNKQTMFNRFKNFFSEF